MGAAITTPKSLLMGYGFETISTADERNAVMGRVASTCCVHDASRAAGGRLGGAAARAGDRGSRIFEERLDEVRLNLNV